MAGTLHREGGGAHAALPGGADRATSAASRVAAGPRLRQGAGP